MNNPLIHVLPLASLALFAASAQAATVWNEGSNGDISSSEAAPTSIVFALGNNVILGSVNGGNDNRDYITFTIGAGQSLTGIELLAYDDLNTGAVNDGNRGFHAINLGATSFIPSIATSSSFLGGNHLDPVFGTNLLPSLGAGIAGTGFTGALGPGTYSYLVQQTGPELTGYSVQFTIVPEPSTLLLSVVGAGMALRRRRRDS